MCVIMYCTFPQSNEVIGQYECNKSKEIAHFGVSYLIVVCPCMIIRTDYTIREDTYLHILHWW